MLNCIWCWDLDSEDLGSAKYHFAAITSRSNLFRSGRICKGLIYGLEPCGVLTNVLNCYIIVSSNSRQANMFPFGRIPLHLWI